MIRMIMSHSAVNGTTEYRPRCICDMCGQPINVPRQAVYAYETDPLSGEPRTGDILILHRAHLGEMRTEGELRCVDLLKLPMHLNANLTLGR